MNKKVLFIIIGAAIVIGIVAVVFLSAFEKFFFRSYIKKNVIFLLQ